MLPRQQRLPRNRIEYLLKKGHKVNHSSFAVKFLPSKNNRFCVIVSTKVEAKATKRNLLRRRIYEALRLNQQQLHKNYDIIFITKPEASSLGYKEITDTLLHIFKNINPNEKK